MKMNTICIPSGHARVEEGSEHFLFYELEERLKKPFIHGNIVGLGIYLMSRLQNNEPDKITRMMERAGLAYQPVNLGLKRDDIRASLLNLRNFVELRKLWYSVLNDTQISESWVDKTLHDLQFEN
jgi:glycerol-1-phosphate dehydrogenase [NAD(P)+]